MDLHSMDPARARTVNNLTSHRGVATAREGQTLDTATAAMFFAMLWTETPRLILQHGEIDQAKYKIPGIEYPGQGTFKIYPLLVVATFLM